MDWIVRIAIFILVVTVANLVLYLLLGLRRYETRDSKIFVKHGLLGKWKDLEDHIDMEH